MSVVTSILFLVLLWKTSEVAATHIAEGYFVVDDKTVQRYMNERTELDLAVRRQKAKEEIIKDVNYFLAEINRIFLTLRPRGLVDIEIRIKQLDILNIDVFSSSIIYQGNQVDEATGLAVFDTWIANSIVGYDFALLWTGYNLRGSITGTAHMGGVCSTQGTSIAEFDGTYRVVHVTAQMIAMILGSSHDGTASTYVMSQLLDPTNRNRWSFSECTGTDISDFINTFNPTCLNTTSASSTKPSVTPDSYTGQLLDPEVVCKRETNSSASYMCKNTIYNMEYPKGDNVCSYIYCYLPGTVSTCTRTYSSDGLICDVGKRCLNGLCQVSSSPATRAMDATCLWGDQQKLSFTNPTFTGDCSGFIQQYGSTSCYNSVVYAHCCSSCKRHITGFQGCEYGDKNADCTKYTQASVCTTASNRNICCNHCRNYRAKRSSDSYSSVAIKSSIPEFSVNIDKLIDKI